MLAYKIVATTHYAHALILLSYKNAVGVGEKSKYKKPFCSIIANKSDQRSLLELERAKRQSLHKTTITHMVIVS